MIAVVNELFGAGRAYDFARHRRQQLGNTGAREAVLLPQQDARRTTILSRSLPIEEGIELVVDFLAVAPLFHHAAQPHERADPREERDVVDRLGEEIVGAGLEAANAVD